MNQTIFSVICGLVILIPLGISNAMIKSITQKTGVNQFLFFRGIVVAPLLIAAFLLNLKLNILSFHFDWLQIIFAFTIAIIGYVALRLLYRAYSLTSVGLASPLTAFNVVVAILLSVIFLGLKLSLMQYIGIAIIVLAIFVIRYDPKKVRHLKLAPNDIKGIDLALLSTLFMGVYLFLVQIPTKVLGPLLTPITSETSGAVTAGTVAIKNDGRISLPNKNVVLPAFIACILITVASIALYLGLEKGNAGIVLALYSSNPIAVTIYGAIVYKEKLNKEQYAAVGLLVLGVVFLRVFG
jgi:drug/metabolite transporter (DMT)-like permease